MYLTFDEQNIIYNQLMGSNNQTFFSNFFLKLSPVWAVEQENKPFIGSKQFYFLSLPVEKEIIINIS